MIKNVDMINLFVQERVQGVCDLQHGAGPDSPHVRGTVPNIKCGLIKKFTLHSVSPRTTKRYSKFAPCRSKFN